MNNTVTMEVNGVTQSVPLLTPQFNTSLALVDINVIKRLAAMLPSADLAEIKLNMRTRIAASHTFADYISVLEDELAFHKSVNLITEYQIPVMVSSAPVEEMR